MSDCLIATGAAVLIAFINTAGTIALALIRAKYGVREVGTRDGNTWQNITVPPQDNINAAN